MKWSRLFDNQSVDLVSYVGNWVQKNPDYKIYIGCDSHNHRGESKTTFATVIVLHRKGSGGHVLYNKKTVPIVLSQFDRLWKEVSCSVEAILDLEKSGVGKPDFVDLDLNPDPKYKSNSLLRAAVGLIESMGIKTRYKSLSPWAISIADAICK